MRALRLASALIGLLVAAASPAETLHVALNCDLRDFATNQHASASRLDLVNTPEIEKLAESNGVYRVERELDLGSLADEVVLEVSPEASYADRRLALRRLPDDQQKMNRNIRVYVVQKEADLSMSQVILAGQYVTNGERERANALLERAFQKLEPNELDSKYGIAVRYNYARSSLDLCLRNAYATCSIAERVCRNLAADRKQSSKYFTDLKIESSELSTCERLAKNTASEEEHLARLREIERIKARLVEASEKIEEGGSEAADGARELDKVVADIEKNAEVTMEDLRTTPADLHWRSGLGYLRFVDNLRTTRGPTVELEEQKTALQAAIERFETAQALGRASATASDIRYARHRLNQVESVAAAAAGP